MKQKVNHSVSFEDFEEFMTSLIRMKDKKIEEYNFNGTVTKEGNKNFSINWTSEEEV